MKIRHVAIDPRTRDGVFSVVTCSPERIIKATGRSF